MGILVCTEKGNALLCMCLATVILVSMFQDMLKILNNPSCYIKQASSLNNAVITLFGICFSLHAVLGTYLFCAHFIFIQLDL